MNFLFWRWFLKVTQCLQTQPSTRHVVWDAQTRRTDARGTVTHILFVGMPPSSFFPSILHCLGLVGNNLFRNLRCFICFSFPFFSCMRDYLENSVIHGFVDRKLMSFIGLCRPYRIASSYRNRQGFTFVTQFILYFSFSETQKGAIQKKWILLEFQSPNSFPLVLQVSPEQWTEELGHPPYSVLLLDTLPDRWW